MKIPFVKRYNYYVVTSHGVFAGLFAGPYPTREAAQAAIDNNELPRTIQAVIHITGIEIQKVRVK